MNSSPFRGGIIFVEIDPTSFIPGSAATASQVTELGRRKKSSRVLWERFHV
jgi:hypothetical protein